MRFMMLVIPGIYAQPDPGVRPDPSVFEAMAKYNESLSKAGVLLALDGLHHPSEGTRLAFAGGKGTVVDGPFAEAKEVIGGYWLIDVKSQDEAVAWARRAPMMDGDVIEVRQVEEMSDFPPEIQAAAASEPALREQLQGPRRS
jgi:hypothetical protein